MCDDTDLHAWWWIYVNYKFQMDRGETIVSQKEWRGRGSQSVWTEYDDVRDEARYSYLEECLTVIKRESISKAPPKVGKCWRHGDKELAWTLLDWNSPICFASVMPYFWKANLDHFSPVSHQYACINCGQMGCHKIQMTLSPASLLIITWSCGNEF